MLILFAIMGMAPCQADPAAAVERAGGLEIKELFDKTCIPSMDVAADGALLAFADSGKRLRRSEDGGNSWSEAQQLGEEAGGNVVVDRNTGDVLMVSPGKGLLYRSGDHGKTWKKESIVIQPNAYGHGTPEGIPADVSCSESGITLQYGEHAGRLLMTARIMPPKGSNDQERWPYHYNTSIYSDDGGKTWQVSNPVQSGTGEGTLDWHAEGRDLK